MTVVDLENAVWGTNKTNQLVPGDEVLVGVYGTRSYLPVKSFQGASDLTWKTVREIKCTARDLHITFTDDTTAGGGVAIRFYARKAVSA